MAMLQATYLVCHFVLHHIYYAPNTLCQSLLKSHVNFFGTFDLLLSRKTKFQADWEIHTWSTYMVSIVYITCQLGFLFVHPVLRFKSLCHTVWRPDFTLLNLHNTYKSCSSPTLWLGRWSRRLLFLSACSLLAHEHCSTTSLRLVLCFHCKYELCCTWTARD